ncbi:MAG: glycosyltransferase family 39 protein, partial [Candidatus Peribacteraceae bacterium]
MALRIMPVISVYGESDETIHDLLIRADGAHYHGLAMQMIDNGFFGFYDKSKANNKEGRREDVVAFRVPLYPIFIRTIYAVFDVKPLVVVVFHVFFDTCIVLLICLWTQKLTDSYLTSLAAGMLYALNPAVILMNSSLFAETMFTAVFTATSLGFLWCLQGKQYWKYIVAGFLIGITTLVKPIEVLFMPALLIMILFSFKKGKKCFSKSVRYALLFSIAFFLTIAPWQARNLWIHGSYSLTYQQGFDLLLHRATWVKTIVEKKNAGVAR